MEIRTPLFGRVQCLAMASLVLAAECAAQGDVPPGVGQALDAHPGASAGLKAFAKSKLLPLCTNPVFVQQVQAQNAKGMSLDQIREIDREWQDAEDPLAIQEAMLGNACAKELRKVAHALAKRARASPSWPKRSGTSPSAPGRPRTTPPS